MKAPRTLLGGAGILLLALLLAPLATAAAPRPVEQIVFENEQVSFYPSPPNSFSYAVNMTWKLSPDDPNQVTGAFNYTIYRNQTSYPTGWIPAYNFSRAAVPGRLGWVYSLNTGADSAVSQSFVTGWNISVQNPMSASPNVAGPTCLLSVDLAVNGSFYQCGPLIEAPRGVSAIVETAATSSSSQTNTTFRWRLSVNDTNQTSGAFTYWLYVGAQPDRLTRFTGTPSLDSTGVLRLTVDSYTTQGVTFQQYAQVRARDPLTHQRSNLSCTVQILGGSIYRASVCGDISSPAGGFLSDGATFPMIDVSDMADATEIDEDLLAGLLGTLLVLGFTGMGFAAARVVGAIVGGIGSLGFATVLGLAPIYVLVVIFLGSMAVIVLTIARGGSQ